MESISAVLIGKALDGLTVRQAAIAQNIANANSPNYRPIRVSFDEALRAAAPGGIDAVKAVKPRVEFAPRPAIASEMRLDLELAASAQTAMRYAALINILDGRAGMMRSVIAGGR